MNRSLNSLSPRFRPLACELIARCVEAGIPVLIVNTLRTPAEQEQNIAKGVSWTKHSKHLTGDAIDLAPYEVYQLHGPDKVNWNGSDPVWPRMGAIGEAIGLRWGGRFSQRDYSHFEYFAPAQAPDERKA